MSRELECSKCGRRYETRDYRLPHVCDDCRDLRVRKTTLHDETKREECNWFKAIYVVDEGPNIHDLPDNPLLRIRHLENALQRARDDMELWGAYASEYFQEKWNLVGDLEAIDAALRG